MASSPSCESCSGGCATALRVRGQPAAAATGDRGDRLFRRRDPKGARSISSARTSCARTASTRHSSTRGSAGASSSPTPARRWRWPRHHLLLLLLRPLQPQPARRRLRAQAPHRRRCRRLRRRQLRHRSQSRPRPPGLYPSPHRLRSHRRRNRCASAEVAGERLRRLTGPWRRRAAAASRRRQVRAVQARACRNARSTLAGPRRAGGRSRAADASDPGQDVARRRGGRRGPARARRGDGTGQRPARQWQADVPRTCRSSSRCRWCCRRRLAPLRSRAGPKISSS